MPTSPSLLSVSSPSHRQKRSIHTLPLRLSKFISPSYFAILTIRRPGESPSSTSAQARTYLCQSIAGPHSSRRQRQTHSRLLGIARYQRSLRRQQDYLHRRNSTGYIRAIGLYRCCAGFRSGRESSQQKAGAYLQSESAF